VSKQGLASAIPTGQPVMATAGYISKAVDESG